MNISQYLSRSVELHRLLNSIDCPHDIDDQYNKFFKEAENIKEKSRSFFKSEHYVSLHDAYIENYSQKKQSDGTFKISFSLEAYLYQDKREIGTLPIQISFNSSQKLREISSKAIYDYALTENEIGIVCCTGFKHETFLANIDSLKVEIKEIKPRIEVSAARKIKP